MSYNPLNAPAKREFARTNKARCVKNEITDMPLALKERSGISAGEYVEFWTMEYEALDARWSDGNPLRLYFGSKLYDKNGQPLDETQRPAVNAQAFAGLGIVVFPQDEAYDASRVIGNVFTVEAVKFPPQERANTVIPTEELGRDFTVAEEDVRVIQSNRDGTGTAQVAVTAATTEILGNVELETQLTDIVGENRDKASVRQALLDSGFGAGMTFNGAGLNGLAISGKLVAAMADAGLID